MIDIHCHILPGIDHDGPVTQQETIEMARLAAADGIRTVIATPHVSADSLTSDQIRTLVEVLSRELSDAEIPLTILPGAEVNASMAPEALTAFTLNDAGYILLEFARGVAPEFVAESVYEACISGLTPIMAHVERLPAVQRSPSFAAELVASGAYIQITAESLTGNLGAEARSCARYLMRQQLVHFLATDAHSTTRRRPLLTEGLGVAASIIGDVPAGHLVHQNPAAVIQGKRLNA